jgi:hypothetical protein
LKTKLVAQIDALRFVVLIPHRDNIPLLHAYSERLFAAGITGAHSFPNVTPLARVSHACSREELKALAHALREWTLADGNDGKLQTGTAHSVSCPAWTGRELTLFGATLETAWSAPQEALFPNEHSTLSVLPQDAMPSMPVAPQDALGSALSALPQEALVFRFPHLILSAALLGHGDERLVATLPPVPSLSFRAAMIANMTLTPLGCGETAYSFAWQIGEPVWLPAYKRDKSL